MVDYESVGYVEIIKGKDFYNRVFNETVRKYYREIKECLDNDYSLNPRVVYVYTDKSNFITVINTIRDLFEEEGWNVTFETHVSEDIKCLGQIDKCLIFTPNDDLSFYLKIRFDEQVTKSYHLIQETIKEHQDALCFEVTYVPMRILVDNADLYEAVEKKIIADEWDCSHMTDSNGNIIYIILSPVVTD